MKRHLWVIEIFTEQGWNAFIADNTIWHTRSDIRKVLKDYKNRWPSMRFRLRKYIPEDNIGNYIVPTGTMTNGTDFMPLSQNWRR